MLLQLKQGSTTIVLSGNGAAIAGCTYVPEVQEQDGRVVESASVILVGTEAAILAQVRAIEAMISRGLATLDLPRDDRLFVEYTSGTGVDRYRSQILDGRVEIVSDPLTPMLASGSVEIRVLWEREPFWEYANLWVPLPLRADSVGSKTTSAVTIYNHDDGDSGHGNYVDIAGVDVAGALPAPLYLNLRALGAYSGAERFYLAANTFHGSDPLNPLPEIWEAEDSDGVGGGTTAAGSSNNKFNSNLDWSSNQEHDDLANAGSSLLVYWQLDGVMGLAKGGWFNVVARFAATPAANIYGKLRLVYPQPSGFTPMATTTVLWEGAEFLLDQRRLQNLGAMPLPPGRGLGYTAPLTLLFTVRAAASGSLAMDFVQLSGPDGFHRFDLRSGLDTNDVVIVDGSSETVSVYDASLDVVSPLVDDFGGYVMVHPGQNTRLRVLFDEGPDAMTIARTLGITAYYRPRMRSV